MKIASMTVILLLTVSSGFAQDHKVTTAGPREGGLPRIALIQDRPGDENGRAGADGLPRLRPRSTSGDCLQVVCEETTYMQNRICSDVYSIRGDLMCTCCACLMDGVHFCTWCANNNGYCRTAGGT
jgi:hypothetical protein